MATKIGTVLPLTHWSDCSSKKLFPEFKLLDSSPHKRVSAWDQEWQDRLGKAWFASKQVLGLGHCSKQVCKSLCPHAIQTSRAFLQLLGATLKQRLGYSNWNSFQPAAGVAIFWDSLRPTFCCSRHEHPKHAYIACNLQFQYIVSFFTAVLSLMLEPTLG